MTENGISVQEVCLGQLSILDVFDVEEGYFEQCLAHDKTIYIVKKGGEVAGYALISWSPRYSLYKKLDVPEIQDVFIFPDFRQQGLATALISECESVINNKNCNYVGISVALHKDAGPAQRLYAKLGYMPDGYGVTYDRQPVDPDDTMPIDDDLCIMLIKKFA